MTDDAKPTITYDDFLRLDLRVARVLSVEDHPNADKLIVLQIDLGGEQRQIIAGLKAHLDDPQSLVGRNIVVVANLVPRKMRGLESNGMLLAASCESEDDRRVICLTTMEDIAPGSAVS